MRPFCVLFAESVADDIALAVAGDDHLVAVGVFKGIDDGEAAIGFYIGFRAFAFSFNNFADGMLAAAAGIDGFDADFVFVHGDSAFLVGSGIIINYDVKRKENGSNGAVLFLFIGQTEYIVGRNLIEAAKLEEMADGKFICSAFVAGIHGLRCTKHRGYLLLRQICIFAQVAYPPDILHANLLLFPTVFALYQGTIRWMEI